MKKIKSYYKIGEISKIYGIGKDSLMYYEKLGILSPVREANGYRLYSLRDIWKLNLIKELRSLDFSMKRIKEYLDERTVEKTEEILNEEIKIIDDKIEELLNHKQNIESRLKSINVVKEQATLKGIKVTQMAERKALILNANITRDEDVDFLIQKLQKEYEEKFYILGNNNIGAIFNLDSINQGIYNEFKSVFCLLEDGDEIYNFKLPSAEYVVYSYRGSYINSKIALGEMFEFIKAKDYHIIGEPIEIYKIDIHETGLEKEFITEIQIPIRRQETDAI
ncbi:MAG: MerR family transcriptional regulator [Cellulosilyticaceae bacterium]